VHPWTRTADGKTQCSAHGGDPFEPHLGGRCPLCVASPTAPALGEWERLADEAKQRGLPSILDYEERFVSMADSAEEKFSDPADMQGMERKGYLDTAVKALRAALEIARYRDDWARIEYRERLKKLGRNGSGKRIKEGN
jgi:hypothetical protein